MGSISVNGEPSYFSNPSSSGAQLLVAVTLKDSGALDVVHYLIDEPGQPPEVARVETSRSRLRESFDEHTAEGGFRMAPADSNYVAWRIRTATERHRAGGGRFSPAAEDALRSIVVTGPPSEHPALALGVPGDAAARVARSATLLDEYEFATWIAPLNALRSFSEKLTASDAGAIDIGTLTPEERTRRTRLAIDAMLDEYCTPEVRRDLVLRLLDTAIVMDSTGRTERALDTLSVAAQIERAIDPASPAHEVPFLQAMFVKALASLYDLGKARHST